MADDFEKGDSPLYARLARAHADDPLVAAIARDHKPRWEVPLRLFAGVHYLALSGRIDDPWASLRDVLTDHREWLARWVAEQPVQTNEVQRSWGLLPAFLTVSGARPLDLVELGSSAGLNLIWDRYRYRYGDYSSWGPDGAPLELEGEARGGPPPELFRRSAAVRERIGLDRSPVDVTRREDTLVLEAFVWADHEERLERLRRALEIARQDPPPLLEGDYLEVLPEILGRSDQDVLTVVYHSASTGYLRREDRRRLAETIEDAGRRVPLAWISYEFVEEEERYDRFALDLRVWPGGERRRLARLDGHANRMRWLA